MPSEILGLIERMHHSEPNFDRLRITTGTARKKNAPAIELGSISNFPVAPKSWERLLEPSSIVERNFDDMDSIVFFAE